MIDPLSSPAVTQQDTTRSRSGISPMEYRILLIDVDTTARRRAAEALIAVPPGPGVAYRIITVGSVGAAQLQAARQRFHLLIASLRGGKSVEELVGQLYDLYRGDLRLLLLYEGDVSPTQRALAQRLKASLVEQTAQNDELRTTVATLLGLRATSPAASAPAPEPTAPPRAVATMPDIQLLLDVLRREAHATLAMFADNIGNVIAQRGDDTGIDVPSLASLVAGSFLNSVELGRVLRDHETIHINVHEGRAYDVYSTNVGNDRTLVLLFDKERSKPRLGYVWLVMKRGAEQLRRMQPSHDTNTVDEAFSQQLTTSLNDEFDRLFGNELVQD